MCHLQQLLGLLRRSLIGEEMNQKNASNELILQLLKTLTAQRSAGYHGNSKCATVNTRWASGSMFYTRSEGQSQRRQKMTCFGCCNRRCRNDVKITFEFIWRSRISAFRGSVILFNPPPPKKFAKTGCGTLFLTFNLVIPHVSGCISANFRILMEVRATQTWG